VLSPLNHNTAVDPSSLAAATMPPCPVLNRCPTKEEKKKSAERKKTEKKRNR
jgi:hypothetical protein